MLQKSTYVSELNYTALSKLAEDLVDLCLWHNQRHVLHLGGAEPPHLGKRPIKLTPFLAVLPRTTEGKKSHTHKQGNLVP